MKKLFQLLIDTSGQSVAIAVMTGLLGGLASAGVIALINYGNNHPDTSKGYLALKFGRCGSLTITGCPHSCCLP